MHPIVLCLGLFFVKFKQIISVMNFTTIPKTENHLHLEGAIPLETLWVLIQKYGGDPSVNNISQLEEKFKYRDFNHFLETWLWKNRYIREFEDFTFISDAVFKDLVKQNIRYAEIFISPSEFRNTLDPHKIIEAISKSIIKNTELRVSLIVDLVRNLGPENAMRTLYEINEVKDMGIIGIGLGGAEKEYPPELFTDVFEKAREFGLKTTAHAGEAAGPESIWGAIRKLRVDRIGHGTRAIEDPELLNYLADNQIPIELCPLSNLRTKVINSIEEHPVRTFIEKGIPVSINTDDPKMFGNSLSEEYQILKDSFYYSDDDICNIIISSIHTMWLDENEKEILIDKFLKELN
jgi:adenosine deaminase